MSSDQSSDRSSDRSSEYSSFNQDLFRLHDIQEQLIREEEELEWFVRREKEILDDLAIRDYEDRRPYTAQDDLEAIESFAQQEREAMEEFGNAEWLADLNDGDFRRAMLAIETLRQLWEKTKGESSPSMRGWIDFE